MNFSKHACIVSIATALLAQSGIAQNRNIQLREKADSAVAREAEPGDDRGRKGRPAMFAREAEPGDDRGRKGRPAMFAREAEPGDDRGRGRGNQPGDDRGRKGRPVMFA
ncbi:MAG: hypothetical protein HY820_35425 [Acidobacteria bacterium]|nr:hypothetical protein [Acidobacteriota bacterium]